MVSQHEWMGMTNQGLRFVPRAALLLLSAQFAYGQSGPALPQGGGATSAAVQGEVTDPSGAVVSGAAVMAVTASGSPQKTKTDRQGRYRIDGLTPGNYRLQVESSGFALFESTEFELSVGHIFHMDVKLVIEKNTETLNVSGSNLVDVSPSQNAGQLVLRGSDLDALLDDSEDLANELQMLAGPDVGPSGPQIYIDGFTDGIMPPKQSIREIHINQNPFSAEFDRVGFGRIEVSTKPGSDKYHGQASLNFGNRALTAFR
jgi:hypothetical protein